MSEPKKLTPEEARQLTEEIRQHEAVIEAELQKVRLAITKTASVLASIANGRDLDDPTFKAQVAARLGNAPQFAELAIRTLKGDPPSDGELIDYCLSAMGIELGAGDE
jgi:hypothetical protein